MCLRRGVIGTHATLVRMRLGGCEALQIDVRVKSRAAANLFDERFIKGAEAGIANRHGCFRDVHFARTQKFRRFLDAFHPQKTREAYAGFLSKEPTKVERAAADFPSEHVERWWIFQIPFDEIAHPLNTLSICALMPVAKEFRGIIWQKKSMCQNLKHPAEIPNIARWGRDRGINKMSACSKHGCRERESLEKYRRLRAAFDEAAHCGLQAVEDGRELRAQEVRR